MYKCQRNDLKDEFLNYFKDSKYNITEIYNCTYYKETDVEGFIIYVKQNSKDSDATYFVTTKEFELWKNKRKIKLF